MDPFSFGSTTALKEEEADRFDVEASLNEATLWQVLMVCKENIVTCKCECRCSLCGKSDESALKNGKKVKKIHGFVALLRPWKEEVKTREKSGWCFCGSKRRLFCFFASDLMYRERVSF